MKKKRSVLLFVLLAYGLSWGLAAVALRRGITMEKLLAADALSREDLLSLGLLGFYMWMPALAALLTTLVSGEGLRARLLWPDPARNWKYDLQGWLLPAVLTGVGAITYFLLFPGRFDNSLVQLRRMLALAAGGPVLVGSSAPALLALLFGGGILLAPAAALFSGPLGEEIGWRGYLYPTLCQRMPERRAVVLSGVIWGLWHTPLLVMGWDYGTAYPGYPLTGILTMTLCTVGLGVFLCRLTRRAGNVWPAALAHGTVNLLFSIFLLGGQFSKGPFNPLLGAHPLTLVGGWALLATGACLLAHPLEKAPALCYNEGSQGASDAKKTQGG